MTMKYFIIFLWLAVMAFVLGKALSVYSRLRKKLRQSVILKLKEQGQNAEFFSNYLFEQIADIIFKAPRSTRKKLLADINTAENKEISAYLKTKNKALYQALKGKNIIPEQTSGKAGQFLAAWYFYKSGAVHKLEKALQKIPALKLTAFEKNLKKLFQAAHAMYGGDLKKAAEKAQSAENWFQKNNFVEEEAETALLLCEVFRMAGMEDGAYLYMAHAKNIYEKRNIKTGIAKIKALKGVEERLAQNFEAAEKSLSEALKAARKNKQAVLECQILSQLLALGAETGNNRKKATYLKSLQQQVKKINDKDIEKRIQKQCEEMKKKRLNRMGKGKR